MGLILSIKSQILVLLDQSAEWELKPIVELKNIWLQKSSATLIMVFRWIYGLLEYCSILCFLLNILLKVISP